MKRWRINFSKFSGCQTDPYTEIASFEVDAETNGDAIRTSLEAMRVASTRDVWTEISVRALVDLKT